MHNRNLFTNKRIIVGFLLLVLIILLCLVVDFNRNGGHLRPEATVQDLVLCSGLDVECTVNNRRLESGDKHIFISGLLQSDLKDIDLICAVRKEPDNELIYYNTDLDLIPGKFFYEVVLDRP